jgi:hypothetical protein
LRAAYWMMASPRRLLAPSLAVIYRYQSEASSDCAATSSPAPSPSSPVISTRRQQGGNDSWSTKALNLASEEYKPLFSPENRLLVSSSKDGGVSFYKPKYGAGGSFRTYSPHIRIASTVLPASIDKIVDIWLSKEEPRATWDSKTVARSSRGEFLYVEPPGQGQQQGKHHQEAVELDGKTVDLILTHPSWLTPSREYR